MPSLSLDPVPSKDATRPATFEVNAAAGAWLEPPTVIDLVTEFVAPWLSVTVSVTL